MPPTKPLSANSPKPEPTFSADDLIAALRVEQGGDGLTSAELADKTGRSTNNVLERLRALWRAGKVDVGKARRPTMIGTLMTVPVYRLKS